MADVVRAAAALGHTHIVTTMDYHWIRRLWEDMPFTSRAIGFSVERGTDMQDGGFAV